MQSHIIIKCLNAMQHLRIINMLNVLLQYFVLFYLDSLP